MEASMQSPSSARSGQPIESSVSRRSFENAVSELTELDEDQLISLLLYLESKNIVSLKALNSILINAIFASGIFDFPDFFRLIAAGVPIGFAELVSEKEIEDSVLYSAP